MDEYYIGFIDWAKKYYAELNSMLKLGTIGRRNYERECIMLCHLIDQKIEEKKKEKRSLLDRIKDYIYEPED